MYCWHQVDVAPKLLAEQNKHHSSHCAVKGLHLYKLKSAWECRCLGAEMGGAFEFQASLVYLVRPCLKTKKG